MTVIICPKCGKKGSLHLTKTRKYSYWRVAHYKGLKGTTRQVKWCYIGKKLPEEIKKQLITQKEHVITKNDYSNREAQEMLKSQKSPRKDTACPGSIVRSSIGGCRPPDPGSNPGQGATKLFFRF